MTDIDKVLTGLECLITNKVPCEGCPYYGSGYCLRIVSKEAKELIQYQHEHIEAFLRDQEPIKPVCFEHRRTRNKYQCGNCGSSEIFKEWEYCPWCGKKVKWDV